jgi:molybdopterin synthase catalytic subunit
MLNEVVVQEQDFDVSREQSRLQNSFHVGAIATFTGYVRDAGGNLTSLFLEHYPGMTEQSITHIIAGAGQRWSLAGVKVIHRVGELAPGEQIVWVGVASAHRADAFSACEYVMDFLKTDAVFWKRERAEGETTWIESREDDRARQKRW